MITITTATVDPSQYAADNAQPLLMWDNLLARGTVADSTLPASAPRANAYDGNTFDYWEPDTSPDTLRATFGASEAANACFIGAHTCAGETVSVQYYNGSTWVTINSVTPSDNQPFMILFEGLSATGWGISTTGGRIGVAWIGPRVVVPGGVVPDYTPVWAARRYTMFDGKSRRGHFIKQRVMGVTAQLSPQFMDVSLDFALNDLADFREVYNTGQPFIFASAPSVFPEDVAYCMAEDGAMFSPSIRAGGELCGLSLSMVAYAEP